MKNTTCLASFFETQSDTDWNQSFQAWTNLKIKQKIFRNISKTIEARWPMLKFSQSDILPSQTWLKDKGLHPRGKVCQTLGKLIFCLELTIDWGNHYSILYIDDKTDNKLSKYKEEEK